MTTNDSNAETSITDVSGPASRQRKWSNLFKALKVGLTLLIFGFIVHTVDLSAAWEQVTRQNLPLVALAAVVATVQIGLGGVRWWIILKRLDARPLFWETLKLFYVSVFVNSYVWGGIGGDVLRAWVSYRGNVSGKTAVTSVVLDRVAALVAVALLVLLTAPIILARTGTSLPMLVPVFLSMVGLVGLVLAAQFERLPGGWLRFRALRLLRDLGGSVRIVFLRPASVVPLIGIAILSQTALGLGAYTMAVSLNMNLSLLECLVLMQPVALVANLPISVGGWGVRETAMIALFGLIGVPASATLVLSIQLGLLSLLVALPGGLLWLTLKSSASRPSTMPSSKPRNG